MTRKGWLWVLGAVVLIVAAAVAIVVAMQDDDDSATASAGDCQVVGELVREWKSVAQQDQTGGEHNDQFAGKVRAAADSVTTPTLKEDLNTWADGFALLADVQRRDAGSSATQDDPAKTAQAGDAIYGTADRLRQACPDTWPTQP